MTAKQVQKKKQREREVKEKLARRREAKLKIEKEQLKIQKENREWEEKQLQESGYSDDKIKPYKKDRLSNKTAEEVRERLEHNLKVLKALEEEYKKEKGADKNLMDEMKKTHMGRQETVLEAVDAVAEKLAATN